MNDNDSRPGLVVVAQELTPYRRHLHRRMVAEIPELKLWSLLTYDSRRSPWQGLEDPAIGVVRFGEGQVEARRSGRVAAAAFELREGARIASWLDQHRIAAILSIGYTEWPLFRPILWARRRHVPVLFWADANIRADHPTGARRVLKSLLFPRLVQWPAALLPCGSLGRAYFLKYGAASDRIFLSPCEPDYAEIARTTSDDVLEVCTRFSLTPGRRRILSCGRLSPAKRPDLAVDAFLAIADRRPEWDLVVAGAGPLAATLAGRVPARLRERVRFTGFLGDQATVSALYRACDVLVHVADFEPWALVINEAAAAGLAIVATDVVGAAAELVRDGVNGQVVPHGDLPAIIGALEGVTGGDRINGLRAASPGVLADWRRRADPIAGMRQALRRVGVLA